MITIDAKTQAVTNAREHQPRIYGHFGYEVTPGYLRGWIAPRYPLPTIPTKVHYVHGMGLVDGVFVRVRGVVKLGAYADGFPCEPMSDDACQACGSFEHQADDCPCLT